MTIPRRPVGGQKGPGLPTSPKPPTAPPSTTDSAPIQPLNAPVPTPSESAATASPPSPSYSISSLLSAYSRSSIDSPVISSEGTGSLRDSQQTAAAHDSLRSDGVQDAVFTASSTPITSVTLTPVPPPKDFINASTTTSPTSGAQCKPTISPIPVETALPPPPPPAKDAGWDGYSSSSVPASQLSRVDLPAQSPPRPQIWRRRSVSKSKDLPPLNLHASHGSTASDDLPQPPPKVESETASVRTQSTTETIKPTAPVTSKPLPTVGLPGRNVRPQQPAHKETRTADAAVPGVSNPTQTSEKPQPSGNWSGGQNPGRPVAERPPTPEYQKEDVKVSTLETFVSPVSPASTPEPGNGAVLPVSKDPSPTFGTKPQKQLPRIDTGSISRKAVASPSTSDLQATRSVPNLRPGPPSPPTAPLPPLTSATPTSAASRSRRPSDAASNRGRESHDTSSFPPRVASVKPENRLQIATPQSVLHQSPSGNDPRLVRSNSGNMLYRGRDGTLYPEMKEAGEPDAQASYFPTRSEGRIPEGTILPAPPLRKSHFVCYQKHRSMGRRINRSYPLACQTCEKADVEDRWVCTFCQLRVCAPCLEKFNTKGRDLEQLVDSLKKPEIPDILNPYKTGQSESGLGLQIDF
ncbi:hypothetical protein LIA77_04223 [Sarocladium implicatum]|nr:hypothetical protein LIA77_04223 [Sarocladium implicatum]